MFTEYKHLTLGQIDELVRRLGGMEAVEAFLRGEFVVMKASTLPLFTTPVQQAQRLLEINESVWQDTSITAKAIRALGDAPEAPSSDENGLYCTVLLAETGDVSRTFMRNWDACVSVHKSGGTWKWSGLVFSPKGICGRKGVKPVPIGLRWAVVELGRTFRDRNVLYVRRQLDAQNRMCVGQELPLIAALHPIWAMSMNGNEIPYVCAPGLEVALNARGKFTHVPELNYNSRVNLTAGEIKLSTSNCSGSGFFL